MVTIRSIMRLLLSMLITGVLAASGGGAYGDDVQDTLNKQRDLNAVQLVYRDGVPHTDRRGRRMMEYDRERSFFQIGLWGVSPPGQLYDYYYDWAVLTEAGFNTVWPWFNAIDPRGWLDAAEEAGLQVVLMGAQSTEVLEQIKDHPNLFGNMWFDEPLAHYWHSGMDEPFAKFLAYRERTKQIAPALPVFVNLCPWIMEPATSWWVKWSNAGDISCHDNYPVMYHRRRNNSLGAEPNGIPQSVALAVAANEEQKPVWLIVGAFDQPPWRMPSPEQLRACVYAGIIHGATGIIYFLWDSWANRDGGCIGMSPDPQIVYVPNPRQEGYPHPHPATPLQMVKARALWATATQINKELTEQTPAILSPTVGKEVEYTVHIEGESPTDIPIRCLLKPDYECGYVLLTANVDDAVLNVTYTFAKPLAKVQVLYENKQPASLEPDSESFTLMYEPFDTHVVRIELADEQ